MLFFAVISCSVSNNHSSNIKQEKYSIVIHGGAGFYDYGKNLELDSMYIASLNQVIYFGDSLLQLNKNAVDVVELCIQILEDNPLFNAGRGSVLSEDGTVNMDASIMDGKTTKAGAVAGLTTTRHPITAARRVMDSTVHVFLATEGAEQFATQQKLEKMPPNWFVTPKALILWQKEIEKIKKSKFGTVGCVVRDRKGNIAAGTSTGGMSMKKWGRIGDAPIIGAGTYASNNNCGISCTGHGEYFIRNVVAYDVAARMEYLKESIDSAANYIVNTKLKNQKASGGLIGIDKKGNITMQFNSSSMFRAYKKEGEEAKAFIK